MADRNTINQKHHVKLVVANSTGVIGDSEGYKTYGENSLRVVTKTIGASGVITVQGRLEGDDTYTAIGTVTGPTTEVFDIGDWDYVRYFHTTADGAGEILSSGFFKASSAAGGASVNSFETVQTDAGTNPVADSGTDTLTLTSSDASITITGNSTTDTIDFVAASAGDVVGPASAVDTAITLFDSTTGKLIKESIVKIDSVGRINLDQTASGDSLYIGEGAGAIDDLSANKNVGIGWTALTLNITGSNNVAIGYGSMRRVTGSSNTGVGYQTLYNATSSALNTALGTSSLNNVTTGSGYNTGLGASSGNANTTGAYNTFLGGLAGGRIKAGSDNITIGYRSGYGVANNSFSDCIYIGNNSGTLSTTGSDNILIGHSLELPTATTSNYISIDDVIFANNSSGNVGIGTTDYASGTGGVVAIVDATAPSGTPTGGGVLYVESGALKYKGSSGTITTLGVA